VTDTTDTLRGQCLAAVVVLSVFAGPWAFAGVAAGSSHAVSISSATEFGDGTIEIVFNQTVSSVDWVDVYVDGSDTGRVQPNASSVDRIEIDSPSGDVTPNRNLTVVAKVDPVGLPAQEVRQRDIAVSATTIDAANSNFDAIGNAAAAYRGEPIAFVSDGVADELVTVETESGSQIFDVRTGTNSEVLVFDSASLTPGTSYSAEFDTGTEVRWFNVSELGLTASQLTDSEQYLAQFAQVLVASAAPNSDVTVELLDEFDAVADSQIVNLGRDRRAGAVLSAPREGEYSIRVTDNATGNVVSGGDVRFVVSPAARGKPVLSATNGRAAVDPGDDLELPISLVNNGSVDVGSLVNPALTNRVTNARGLTVRVDPENEAPMTVHAGTYGIGSLPAGRLESLDVPVSIDGSAEPGTYRVPINVSYRYTAEIHDNGSEETETVRRDLNVSLTVDSAPHVVVRNVTTSLRAGSTDAVALTVENVGDAVARESWIQLTSPNPEFAIGSGDTATRSVGTWATDERRTFEFEVSAPTGTVGQRYPLELEAIYEDADGRTATSSTRFVSVSALSAQRFELEAVSSELRVGDRGQLTGRVTNVGGERVTDAVVVVADDHPHLDLRERRTVVGTVAPNESAEFAVPVQVNEDAEPGPRQFSVFVEHRRSPNSVIESPTLDARATVEPDTRAFRVEPVDASAAAGGTGHLNLTVTNTGDAAYTDVTPRLFLSGPLSTADGRTSIDRLGAGESTTVSIPVSASGGTPAKAYPTSVIIKYDDSTGERRASETFRQGVEVVVPAEDSGGSGVLPIVGVVVVLVLLGYGYVRWRR
jgi:hypothetical protein